MWSSTPLPSVYWQFAYLNICKYLNICMWSYDPPPLCQLIVWEGGVCISYTNIWIFEYMQICKYSNICMGSYDPLPCVYLQFEYLNICKHTNIWIFVWDLLTPLPCVYWKFEYLNICKSANIQMFVCDLLTPLPLCLLTVNIIENQIFEYIQICKYLYIIQNMQTCSPCL